MAKRRRGQVLSGVLIVIALATVASALWWIAHRLPDRIADTAHEVESLILFVLAVAAVFLVAAHLYLAYALWRFRHHPQRQSMFIGVTRKEWLPVLAIAAVLLAFDLTFDHRSNEVWAKVFLRVPENAFRVEITGEQFAWGIRYPGKDGEFGRTDLRLVSDSNPLGIDPNDPASKDDIVFPAGQGELHLPLNHPVVFLVRSKDVIHSFFVPFARLKMDAVPGMTTRIWFTPTKAGTYEFACAELCGLGHYRMRGVLVVEPMEQLQKWLSEQQTFGETMP
ncbi:Alternative cytochrome c oxidase subunit 2 [bacterium HR17]|jgi:cytochrome c oxidase subunit 2|uniref:cytochrome-c oxidase n=1 Tax=Candidatus Fervidibacter japonicus TaxID=2035412 RepID=A0A2H5XB92_9BACT|nr:Alternative cytochrome c oxidase subunit 2 [bacterium HR17]